MNKKVDESVQQIESEFESNLGKKISENENRYFNLINESLYRLPAKSMKNYFSYLLNDYKQKPTKKTEKAILNSIENILQLFEETKLCLDTEVLIKRALVKDSHDELKKALVLVEKYYSDSEELFVTKVKLNRRKPNLKTSKKVHALVKKGITPYKASQMVADEEAKESKGKICSSKNIFDNYLNHVKKPKHLKILESEFD
jgi:hypothetical protein